MSYPRYKGDELKNRSARLVFVWRWAGRVGRGGAGQCSESRSIDGWTLTTTQWGSDSVWYEASIEYYGRPITSIGGDEDKGFKTREDAQVAAERLLHEWLEVQLTKVRRYSR